jgi:hypothetical protein
VKLTIANLLRPHWKAMTLALLAVTGEDQVGASIAAGNRGRS